LFEGVFTSWARDVPTPIEDGQKPGKNNYGVQPVLFGQASTDPTPDVTQSPNRHFVIYNHNGNAQDVRLKNQVVDPEAPATRQYVQVDHYISGTGIIDMYVIMDKPNPEAASKAYQRLVGIPQLVPYWSLGWHQCRYGYRSTKEL